MTDDEITDLDRLLAWKVRELITGDAEADHSNIDELLWKVLADIGLKRTAVLVEHCADRWWYS